MQVDTTDGISAIRVENSSVAILPYTVDSSGSIEKIGTYSHRNPHFDGGSYTSVLLGDLQREDQSIFSRCVKVLTEKTGIENTERTRWSYLGEMNISIHHPDSVYCYAVDITDLDPDTASGFSLVPLSSLKKENDMVIQACFYRLFTTLYKKQII